MLSPHGNSFWQCISYVTGIHSINKTYNGILGLTLLLRQQPQEFTCYHMNSLCFRLEENQMLHFTLLLARWKGWDKNLISGIHLYTKRINYQWSTLCYLCSYWAQAIKNYLFFFFFLQDWPSPCDKGLRFWSDWGHLCYELLLSGTGGGCSEATSEVDESWESRGITLCNYSVAWYSMMCVNKTF